LYVFGHLFLLLIIVCLAAITETVGDALKNVAKTFSADGGEVGSKFKSDGSIGQQGEKGKSSSSI
jgi:hypothetical protein